MQNNNVVDEDYDEEYYQQDQNEQDQDEQEQYDDQQYDDQQEEDKQEDQQTKTKQSTQLSKNHLNNTVSTQSTKQSDEIMKQRQQERERQRRQIREGLPQDLQLEQERKNLWKEFGIDSAAGKELFNLYRCHKQPTINYPKPRPKKVETVEKIIKPCPQKTAIEYPTPIGPSQPQFHRIDMVPRRKREQDIRKEIEKQLTEFKKQRYQQGRKFFRPKIAGRDRSKLIDELCQKFKYQGGALPKGAELPQIDMKQVNVYGKSEETKSQAIKRTLKKDLFYTGLKPESKDETETRYSVDPKAELNMLFDQILQEIEERQEFLEDVQNLQEPKLKQRVKDEIIERVAELQKITDMKKQF